MGSGATRFKVVIAPREGEIPAFADIFRNNCAKNGLLTIELTPSEVDHIFQLATHDKPLEATVNLTEQTLTFESVTFHFQMDPAVKEKLQLGMDDIAESLNQLPAIEKFEKTHNAQLKD